MSHEAAWWAGAWCTWACEKGNSLVLARVAEVEVGAAAAAEEEVEVVATRSQEGHMVRVVAGSCM